MLGRFDRGDESRRYGVPDHRAILEEWAYYHFIKFK